ncbi:hypothetical protein OG474_41460 [Kribbella sp. NBC_01505]|uniref:hypothetical protein n=1 Tax=Kribbella sp. NBC_01505 TaxID=2903580 RepID=UPI0038668B44
MQAAEIWDKINESTAVIAWPAVVAFGMILFRRRLGELFQRLREAVIPGGSMKFDPGAQIAANQGIARSGGTLVAGLRAGIEAAQRQDDPATNGDSNDESSSQRAPDMHEIKDDVEDLISASFKAGFSSANTMRRMGVEVQPSRAVEPVIEWNGSVPTVRGYRHYDAFVEEPGLAVVELMSIESERAAIEAEAGYIDAQIEELQKAERDGGITELRRLELAERLAKRAMLRMNTLDLDARLANLRRRTFGT